MTKKDDDAQVPPDAEQTQGEAIQKASGQEHVAEREKNDPGWRERHQEKNP